MAHYTSDVGVIREAISQGITTFLSSIITIVGVFIMMLSYSVMMTLVVMALLGLTFLVILLFAKKSMNNFKAQQATIAVLNGYMEEMMNGQKVVKVFVHEEKVRDEFSLSMKRLEKPVPKLISMPVLSDLSPTT